MPSQTETESAMRAIGKIDELRELNRKGGWPHQLVLEVAFYSMEASAHLFVGATEKANEALDKALVAVKDRLAIPPTT